MRKLFQLLLVLAALLLLPASSRAQYVVTGQGCGASGINAIANDGTPVVCRGNASGALVWTAVGGGGSSGSQAASPSTTIHLWDAKYNFPGTTQWVCDAGMTNTSNIVTTPATDPPFTGSTVRNAQVGDIMWGAEALCGNEGTAFNVPVVIIAQGTITSVDSAHQVHVSNNASATCTVVAGDDCVFVWGPDATAAVQSAWQDAATACGSLELAASGILIQTPPVATNNPCPSAVSGNDAGSGVTVFGQGPYATMIISSPTSTFGNAVFGISANTGLGPRRIIHDFGMASFSPAPAGAANYVAIDCTLQQSNCYRIWYLDYFPSVSINVIPFSANTCSSCGTTARDIFVEGSGNGIAVGGTFTNFYNLRISSQSQGNALQTNASGNIYNSVLGSNHGNGGSGSVYNCSGLACSINFVNSTLIGGTNGDAVTLLGNAGTIATFRDVILQSNTNKAALRLNASNTAQWDGVSNSITGIGTGNGITNAGTVVLRNTTVTSGTGLSLSNSGTVQIKDGVTFPKGITNTGVLTVVQGVGGFNGACTGTVTSAATVGLYGLGQNTATTCTSTTVASGVVMGESGTVYALYCTAGTGGNQATDACTVVKNGAAQTMTCSLNGVTSCTDGTVAHFVTYVQGDILGIEVIAGTGTTLANVKGVLVAPQ